MRINFIVPVGWVLLSWGLGLLRAQVSAQTAADYAVQVSALVHSDPPQIQLVWPPADGTAAYAVQRKSKEDVEWGAPVALPGAATSYLDTDVRLGEAYEYHVQRVGNNYNGHGYVLAGIQIPLVEDRGKLLLLVDQSHSSSLTSELARLQEDLVGDGWRVLRYDIPRASIDPANTSPSLGAARSNEVANVKSIIKSAYIGDRNHVKAVFLLGHLPVPYSGSLAPDHHPEHNGAWPADVYYADMDGTWTDSAVTAITAADSRNHNVPGDGKFDQSSVPAKVALAVGRVDLANLPLLPLEERELLRHYLEKDHAFRHRLFTAQPRALISDNLGVLTGEEVPTATAWMNFAPLFGAQNLTTDRWLTVLPREDYLWGFGAGPGSYTGATGVAETSHFLVYDPKVVFTMLFGSYFGDWDTPNNFLRAQLTASTYTLTAAWVGRPNWFFHMMGLGEPIGLSTRLSQNNVSLYQANSHVGEVHMALMGDPTLRLHTVAPPLPLSAATNSSGGVDLRWGPSPDSILGYYIYRANLPGGPYARVSPSLVQEVAWTDPVLSSERFYMVRAVKLESSGSGTYFNASQGVFAEAPFVPSLRDDSIWDGRGSRTWRLSDASGTAGLSRGWDLLTVNGVLDIRATETDRFRINIFTTQLDGTPGFPAGFDRNNSYRWTLAVATTSVNGFDPSKLELNTSGFQGDLAGGSFTLVLSDDRKSIDLLFLANRPPATVPAFFRRVPGTTLRLNIADFLGAYSSDPDGDPRALLTVGTSTNGSSILTDGSAVLFNSANDLTETFTYTIRDVRNYRDGDTIQTAVGSITVESPNPDGSQNMVFYAFRAIELEWQSERGKKYQIQSRSEGETLWTNQGEPFIGTGEKMSLFERAKDGNKFYRIVATP